MHIDRTCSPRPPPPKERLRVAGLSFLSVLLSVSVFCSPRDGQAQDADTYALVDASSGWESERFPVSFGAGPPPGGWSERHKDGELALRKITLPDGGSYYLGVFEVTRGQWTRLTGSDLTPVDWPVTGRSYANMAEFAATLQRKTGLLFSLPTEAQWEWACRAGSTNLYFFGSDDPSPLPEYAWFLNSSGGTLHPAGARQPNPWGLFDLYGNAAELCQGGGFPLRGGHHDSSALACTSSGQTFDEEYSAKTGFRVCMQPCTLTVRGGSGSGIYLIGATAQVAATNDAGNPFVKWRVDPPAAQALLGAGFIATNASTALAMPAQSLTLTAAGAAELFSLTVLGGSGSGSYLAGEAATLSADPPAAFMRFDRWTGDTGTVCDVSAPTTTVVLPPRSITLTATYAYLNDGAFSFTVSNGSATITGYVGSGGDVCIPLTLHTVPVTGIGDRAFSGCTQITRVTFTGSVVSIGNEAFSGCTNLTSITLPSGLRSIGDWAFQKCALRYVTIPPGVTQLGGGLFYACDSLRGVFFQSSPPAISGRGVGAKAATVYYLPEQLGWEAVFGYRPTQPWDAHIQPGAAIGFYDGRFRFTLSGAAALPVVVEACTNLAVDCWTPLETNMLDGAGALRFSDPAAPAPASRFYRVVWP